MRSRAFVALLMMLILAGCSKPATTTPAPVPVPVPSSDETPAAKDPWATGPLSEALFPQADYGVRFDLQEEGQQPAPVDEALLRDGDRAVAVQGRSTYATWHIRPDGVWRLDPKGGGAYLRYLPPELQDGLVWHQPSGKSEVWFRLTKCAFESCWEVTVLNGSECTRLQFERGKGVAYAASENLADPQASYTKRSVENLGTSDLNRAALLKTATPGPGEPPPSVSPGTAEEFRRAFFAALNEAGRPITQVDLDGNGKPYTIQGPLGTWTKEVLPVYAEDGTLTGKLTGWSLGEHKIEVKQIPSVAARVLLQWDRAPGGPTAIGIVVPVAGPPGSRLRAIYGWAPKDSGTQASRVTIGDDGLITVEWDMGDPAGHTRISQYRFQQNPPQVTRLSTSYRPTEAALVRPQSAQDVLQAAFVAKWAGLDAEIPRYFASPEAARPLRDDKRITPPDYAPGKVVLGTVTPTTAPNNCMPEVTPGEPKVPGSIGFRATWGGYEWGVAVSGTVTFTLSRDGLPLIERIEMTAYGVCAG